MTQADASRIQSSQAKGGNDPGFARRAQSAAAHNANASAGKSGGNGFSSGAGSKGSSGGGKK